ncbi:MAG: hypothetical protein OHK0022_09710 [Roseiflexaceae bacterium]
MITQFRSLGRAVQVLLINQLAITTGFYMLFPYIALHMTRDLGLEAWLVGLVLGVGNLSQQGLFLLGGSLGDRIGFKRVIVLGCGLRAAGFLAYGLADSLATLLLAALLSGLAAALFGPAVRALLAQEAGEKRIQAFALFSVFANGGLLLGPLLGMALLQLDFRAVALAAAAIFALLTLVQTRHLPAHEPAREQAQPLLLNWREAFSNRPFVLFALAMLGYFALYVQFYLGLPLGLQRSTGSEEAVGSLFTIAAVLSMVAQVHLTNFSQRRWSPARAISIGLATMGLAFVPLLLATPLLPVPPEALRGVLPAGIGSFAGFAAGAINFAPVLLATVLLTVGSLIAQPFAMGLIPVLGRERLLGTYFGVYYLSLGLGGLLGNLLAGVGFDMARRSGFDGLPWMLLLLVGCCSAASIAALERRGALTPAKAT